MGAKFKLTAEEQITLQQLSLKHQHRDIRTRASGLLLLAQGMTFVEAAARVDVSDRVIYNWVNAWHNEGICGLFKGHTGGRPHALSAEMLSRAMFHAESEARSLSQIAKLLEVEFGKLPCTLQTLANSLKSNGFSYKRARYTLKKNAINKPL